MKGNNNNPDYTLYYFHFSNEGSFYNRAICVEFGPYTEAVRTSFDPDDHKYIKLPPDKIENIENSFIRYILDDWKKCNFYNRCLTEYPWFYRKIVSYFFNSWMV
jgi:hypothetical protein